MPAETHTALELRKTIEADLDTFFLFQLDEAYNHMAAFTSQDHADREAYLVKWNRLITDPAINMQSIIFDGILAGSVFTWLMEGEPQISYGVARQLWGRGIATAALRRYLALESTRPLYGRVAFDNIGSQKVLERCGFMWAGTELGYANARGGEIEEFVYTLSS